MGKYRIIIYYLILVYRDSKGGNILDIANKINYANRCSEFYAVENSFLLGKDAVFLIAGHAYGVTSFLKTLCERQRNSSTEVFYLNASQNKSFSELLLEELVRSSYLNDLQKMVDKKYGSKTETALESAVKAIPYAGELIASLISKKQAIPIYTGCYPSIIEEILIPFFNKCFKKNKVIIAVDNSQEINEESYMQFTNLLLQCKVKIIFVITSMDDNYLKLENYISNFEVIECNKVIFDPPQIKLVKELGIFWGCDVSTEEAEIIIKESEQNIHRIVANIKSVKQKIDFRFTPGEKTIVSLLYICSFPVTHVDMRELLGCAGQYYKSQNEWEDDCFHLISIGVIGTTEHGYVLESLHHPEVETCISSVTDMLLYSGIVYDYYSNLNSAETSNTLSLLYKLSVQLQFSSSGAHAKKFLLFLLKQGTPIPKDIVIHANLSNDNAEDNILASIISCKERDYELALSHIERLNEERIVPLNAYKAVLLNRTRDNRATQELKDCILSENNPAIKNLLLSFLVSDYIHSEKLLEAKDLFEEYASQMQESYNFGYFARNTASAYKGFSPHYDLALKNFKLHNDLFGYYSTLCNKGYSLCLENQFSEALICFKEAENGLLQFGQVNAHIIFNDLGIYHLLNDDPQETYKYLNLAIQFAKTSMPLIFTKINMAVFYVTHGKLKPGISLIRSLEAEVNVHPLDRVRQKYFINRILIEFLTGNREISQLITFANRHPDRYNPNKTKMLLEEYKNLIKQPNSLPFSWKEFYSPCGLVYWYVDPLKIIPKSILDQISAIHT